MLTCCILVAQLWNQSLTYTHCLCCEGSGHLHYLGLVSTPVITQWSQTHKTLHSLHALIRLFQLLCSLHSLHCTPLSCLPVHVFPDAHCQLYREFYFKECAWMYISLLFEGSCKPRVHIDCTNMLVHTETMGTHNSECIGLCYCSIWASTPPSLHAHIPQTCCHGQPHTCAIMCIFAAVLRWRLGNKCKLRESEAQRLQWHNLVYLITTMSKNCLLFHCRITLRTLTVTKVYYNDCMCDSTNLSR